MMQIKTLFAVLLAFCAPLYGDPAGQWQREIIPILENYCYDCHADGAKKGDFSLDAFASIAAMQSRRDIWKRVRENLAYELMPPINKDQPSPAERRKLIDWVDAAVFPVDPLHPDPGRVTLRRLNRFEYQNTLRDLIGVKPNTDLLLPDDSGYGFDNIADVLTLSPTHLEAYLNTASRALDTVYGERSSQKKSIELSSLKGSKAHESDTLKMFAAGVRAKTLTEKEGEYTVVFRLSGTQAGDEPVKAKISLGDQTRQVIVDKTSPVEFSISGDVKDSQRTLSIEFVNDFWEESTKADRNLIVHSITLEGPVPKNTHANALLFPPRKKNATDSQYIASVLRSFLSRAFRRPATESEIIRYAELVARGRSNNQSVELAMRPAFEAAMISPQFLFRELHAVYSLEKQGKIVAVPELSLASRMSYFLWSSTPDDATLSLAANEQLRSGLNAEIDRMIHDPKTVALIDRFFAQWLQFDDVSFISIDDKIYPSFKENLRANLIAETRNFCIDLWKNNLPVTRLIDANYTFVNEALAKHYNIPNVSGTEFRKVAMFDPERVGILTHGSILALTSNPNRTSPVKRGKWVLETLLDAAPPPPPPNVPSLAPPHKGSTAANLRAQLELHRKDPACASCHKLMDGIGFSFEAYDVDGSRRAAGPGLDTRGSLSTGETVDSPAALAKLLTGKRLDEFHRAFAVKLLTFALGRGLEYYDKPAIDQIVAQAAKGNYSLHSYLHAIINSFPFQNFRK
jgi:hypothetical protein